MSELLRINRETPVAAAELADHSAIHPHEPGVRVVAQGREVVVHIDNALVDLLARTISGIVTVCARVGKLLSIRGSTRNGSLPVAAEARASRNDDYAGEMDKAA